MKRDMDLVRAILIAIEREQNTSITNLQLDDYCGDGNENYHVVLMIDAGLIEGNIISSTGGSAYIINGLTWEGHEFLDAARSESLWKKAKEIVVQRTGSLTIEALKIVLQTQIKDALN